MNLLNDIIVTDIEQPYTVYSAQGRTFKMINRPSFGLSFCIKGQITYTMNGNNYVSDASHAVLLPQAHSYTLYGDKEGSFPLINFKCQDFESDTILVLPLQNPQACIKDYEKIKSLFLFKENRLRIYGIFYELLNKVFQEQLPQQNMLYPAVKYLENHLSDPELSNAALAKQAGISEVYLRKLFLAQYNTTPKQYILDIRLQKAKQLLSDTQLTITAISESCGFSSLYHFCRAFKERTGITPTEYARQNKIFRL